MAAEKRIHALLSYDPSHVFQPVREHPLLTDRETFSSDFSFSTSSVSNEHDGDVFTTDSLRDDHDSDRELRAQVAFEPQRTTSYHREGYNTPKPYKPPPTSPTPRHGAFPLARPGYGGEHGLAAYPEHGPEHGVGLYDASEHSLLGHSAAKHVPGYAQSYLGGHRGYAGYPHGYSVYVHGYRTVPYTSTVVHSDQHQYVGPAYSSGHGDNTLRYGVHPYHTGSGYYSGYTSGHSHLPRYAGEAGHASGRGHLHGVQLYQITQPLDPHHPNHLEYDHGTHDYVPPGYGTPSHVSPGHGTPGYVSLEYVPAGHAGGYGLKRPEYSSVYHDDYAQYARYGGRCAGRCLKKLDHKVNYTEAESQCAALGAHLAVPRSDEENQCAMDATLGTNLWLGITDVVTEGQFVGADGCGTVSSSSPYWANGQPNNLNDQDYGLLAVEWPANGWHDVPAHAQHRPFCQLLACYQHGCQ
ncbi:CD209 antigen-like protein E [Amphibalanus amphitrite]|uniref:CD209 antigen-like protein E n=1 Tax=Amphibalanus amphitrite TaxID=1232801 RepID=A0A6A4WN26_AMPAM|nr:CD209 antigen-like protein E [Amphibalanus amphitrite]